MRGFHRIAFIGIEKEPVWPENKNDRHYSLTFSIDIHYRDRCPQAVVSAPFPTAGFPAAGVKRKLCGRFATYFHGLVIVSLAVRRSRRHRPPPFGLHSHRAPFLRVPLPAGPAFSLIHPFPVLRVPSRSQGLAAVLHPVLMGFIRQGLPASGPWAVFAAVPCRS